MPCRDERLSARDLGEAGAFEASTRSNVVRIALGDDSIELPIFEPERQQQLGRLGGVALTPRPRGQVPAELCCVVAKIVHADDPEVAAVVDPLEGEHEVPARLRRVHRHDPIELSCRLELVVPTEEHELEHRGIEREGGEGVPIAGPILAIPHARTDQLDHIAFSRRSRSRWNDDGVPTTARYDGLDAWYDEFARPSAESSHAAIADLLPPGDGSCIDVGCGTGLYFDTIRAAGRDPIGIDVSRDQLRRARQRGSLLAQADGMALPIRDGSVDTIVALWVSTDVDDFSAITAEAARCLRRGGTLLVYGVHPCFNGPLVENLEDGSRVVHPGYRDGTWHDTSPWWSDTGVRSRVGMRHVPLAELLNAIAETGLRITRAEEPRAEDVPYILAVVAKKL